MPSRRRRWPTTWPRCRNLRCPGTIRAGGHAGSAARARAAARPSGRFSQSALHGPRRCPRQRCAADLREAPLEKSRPHSCATLRIREGWRTREGTSRTVLLTGASCQKSQRRSRSISPSKRIIGIPSPITKWATSCSLFGSVAGWAPPCGKRGQGASAPPPRR